MFESYLSIAGWMKFLHTASWHLGHYRRDRSLPVDQATHFHRLVDPSHSERVDTVALLDNASQADRRATEEIQTMASGLNPPPESLGPATALERTVFAVSQSSES